jgi:AsmA protein
MYSKLMLDANITDWSNTLTIAGTVQTGTINPGQLAKRLAVELPPMQDSTALSKLQLTAPFKLQGNSLQAQPDIVFDDSIIDADVSVALDSQAVRYDIAIDSIDANRYMPPPAEPVAETAGEPVEAVPEQDLPIPLELIRTLDIEGELKVGSARLLEYDIANISMHTVVKGGIVNISPASLDVLDGHVDAHITLDARKDVPVIEQQLAVQQVQIRQIANPIIAPLIPSQQIDASGKGDIKLDVKTRGMRISQLMEKLQGTAVIDFNDIIADGLDTDYLISTTVTDFTSSKSFSEKIGLTSEYRPKTETAFELIHASFDIRDGRASTQDMLLDSKRIDITGNGWVDIVKQTMDMNIVSDVTLYKTSSVTDNLADEPLPVHITGAWAAPVIDIDYGPMKQRFKREYTDKLKARVQKKTDALKQKLSPELGTDKPALDAKKEAVKEKLNQKLKDRTKDKLKGLFR